MRRSRIFDLSNVQIRRGTRQQGGDWTLRAFYGTTRIGYLMTDSLKLEGRPPEERATWKAWVEPEFRRKGVATKLYDTAEAWLDEQGLKLVPGLGIQLRSVSDEAYKFWANRDPDDPAVLDDARRFEEQYSGKPFPYRGGIWFIDHTAGRERFIVREEGGGKTIVVKAHLVWDLYGKPGEPMVTDVLRDSLQRTHNLDEAVLHIPMQIQQPALL